VTDVVAIAATRGFVVQASLAQQGLMDEKLSRVYLQRERLDSRGLGAIEVEPRSTSSAMPPCSGLALAQQLFPCEGLGERPALGTLLDGAAGVTDPVGSTGFETRWKRKRKKHHK
jgi:hypothetical protein